MTHIITSLCLRDGGCIEVCPVECIIGGKPESEWPWMYIDPDTCIDCGACIPECPFEAIFTEDEVPADLVAKAGQQASRPGDPNYTSRATEHYEGHNNKGQPIILEEIVTLAAGDVINLRNDIQPNYDFYKVGPGYNAGK
ncbi:MAG: ferredoxin family protein [Anaerolineales bacterium]|nr:ferredoxin family protein [Anaerolineales bacterium]